MRQVTGRGRHGSDRPERRLGPVYDSATNQPTGRRKGRMSDDGVVALARPDKIGGYLLSPEHRGSIPVSHASSRSLAQSGRQNRSRPRQLEVVYPYGRSRSLSLGNNQELSPTLSARLLRPL